jgi:4a-hydroxytetrahydrobiopterin dehydratase
MALLTDHEIAERLQGSAWRHEGDFLVRDWKFKDFRTNLAFVMKVADVADELNHHPDILVHRWNKLRLSLWSHDFKGITAMDFGLAERIDALDPGETIE